MTPNLLIAAITGASPELRDRSIWELIEGLETARLRAWADELEAFRRETTNLYERVRAATFLHAIHRYRLQESPDLAASGTLPYQGVADLLARRFESAIATFRAAAPTKGGLDCASASALALAYEHAAFQTLADQVRRSVRGCAGNRWMFRVGSPDEHPVRLVPPLLRREGPDGPFPVLVERTPVRLDLSHSAWSDIFFLGMDYPEGARVLNISVDLAVHGRDDRPAPPIETYCRIIAEPVLRLSSIDLNATKDVTSLAELFNFGNDYLGLVKAGVIASGLVPPSFEGTGHDLGDLLGRIIRPGHGLEVVSKVNDIPKGSRLAVSTNLLASLISLLMRATGQALELTGPLGPDAARVVVARAILGEWLGGSGGGWQDSGGVFPGIKLIEGVAVGPDSPELGTSRGQLLPRHVLGAVATEEDRPQGPAEPTPGGFLIPESFDRALAQSLVLVHGGMAQNVGPILNMVTTKYLLRERREWDARAEAVRIFERIVAAVGRGDVREVARLTTANWEGPLKTIIPWVSNRFTETLIAESRRALGDDFWGFLMLGGMSGGGMGFFVAPERHARFRDELFEIMRRAKQELDDALPFAMGPVVYDFEINRAGTCAELKTGPEAMMPARYYALQAPQMIAERANVPESRRVDFDHFVSSCPDTGALLTTLRTIVGQLFPVTRPGLEGAIGGDRDRGAARTRRENGFDPVQHEQLRNDLLRGRIGVARNRLPVDAEIQDVRDDDLIDAAGEIAPSTVRRGAEAIARGEVAVVSLAAGVGSRWTTGAGVVKAVNPFVSLAGRHRCFVEIHFAKTRRTAREFGAVVPHVVTTSFLTHPALERHLARTRDYGHDGPVVLSRGQSIGQRLVPMARDLRYIWEETAQEVLDENKQKVREASRRAVLDWAKATGEGSDYVDNVASQLFNPPGHFYEVPNMLRNGALAGLLRAYPSLRWLMVHNIDTLGADLAPGVLGLAIESGATLSFEVVPRRIEDRGGGLARVNGRPRLVEGLALPREELEFDLRFYNTLTTWVDLDGLLRALELTRAEVIAGAPRVADAVRALAARLPTYVTIKDVKRRWGHGQEDVFPVTQFEKLWGDLSSLTDIPCAYLCVSRRRGQQLKGPEQLDGWANDGSRDHVLSLCAFPD